MAVNAALDASIELTEFIATASGWKDWLIPDSVQELAKALLPGMKSLRGQINAPLQRASNEIREFLDDLLGEQAAAVVMMVGERAVQASAVPATRARSGHNAADAHPRGSVPARQTPKKVGGKDEASAGTSAGPVHAAVQVTRKAFTDIANREKGLIGEHMADYHELKRLGGTWPHDKESGAWSPEGIKKINADRRPVNLSLKDLPKVTQPGIDAVWEHNGKYTVTEAKFSASIATAYAGGKTRVNKGSLPAPPTGLGSRELLYYLLSDSSDKLGKGSPMVQMSIAWVEDRAAREGVGRACEAAIRDRRYARRTVLVTFESVGAVDHGEALVDINMGKLDSEVHPHPEHGLMKEWDAGDIDAVVAAREKAFEARKATRSSASSDTKPKPTKPTKGK
jgi:hypothetical protein